MNNACMSNCKDESDRSDKECVCGGHNQNNPKSNLLHFATKRKREIRQERKRITKKLIEYAESLDW